ncbi:MAG: hypothetical protein MI866_18325 [Bacteroidales bacterium]|nr:hypothetical protein [Bacteroidales bacterium]
MLTKTRYSLKDMVLWTRGESLFFVVYAFVITFLYEVLGFVFIDMPWTAIALVGTAVAFIVGFQNNAAYGRIWEARKIWGGIVNTSRSWGMMIQAMLSNEYAIQPMTGDELTKHKQQLVYRHIAWLTALRHAMRQTKKWEVFEKHRTNREWSRIAYIPERVTSLNDDLLLYLSPEEHSYVMSKDNKAAALLYLQSNHLKDLKEKKIIWEFAFLNLENKLSEMFDLQGKSERIKNFPYPRQYATLSHHFVWLFLLMLPLALVSEFESIAQKVQIHFPVADTYFVWLAVPFCGVVSWIFHTMMRIGTVGENPFEGSANDVPISTIARGIERDLRQLMNEETEAIPSQFPEKFHVQM